MREALLIFRKDVHHLWPRIIPVLAVTALVGWTEWDLFTPNPFLELLHGLWLLCAAYLVASTVHEEPLPGHQQYWLTRPYSRRQLVLAKMLFLTTFTGLPMLVEQAVTLSVNGVSPWRHVTPILSTTLIFAGGACLVAAALASVTENLVQLLWGLLPAVGLVILGLILAGSKDHTGDWQWGRIEWIRSAALGMAILAVAITVLALQYSLRMTAASRILVGGMILIAAAGPFLGSWHSAWAFESKLSSGQLAEPAAHIAFDSSKRPAVGFADAVWSPGAGEAGINLPILMTGIPVRTALVCERIAARIETPDGRQWASAWTQAGGLYSTTPLEDAHVISRDGAYWQYVGVDEAFYESAKDRPVHMHATLALTLLGDRRTTPLATRDRNQSSLDGGMCRVGPGPFGKLIVSCAWVAHSPARSYVTAISVHNGQTYSSLISSGPASPYASFGSVWQRASTLFSSPPATHEMDLETWQALAHFERELDLPHIRLSDYRASRISDMP